MSRITSAAAPRSAASSTKGAAKQRRKVSHAAEDYKPSDEVDCQPIVHRRTSVAETGVDKPAGAVASVFEAGRNAAPNGWHPRKSRTYLDAATIAIDVDVPLPRRHTRGNDYAALLARMPAGASVLLTKPQAKGLAKVARAQGINVTLRRDGDSDGIVRVWRLPAGKAAAGAAS